MTHSRTPQLDCSTFESRLGGFLEGDLTDEQRAGMDAHRFACTQCAKLAADLDGIIAGATALPALKPSRDLWPGIESRINTPVVALNDRVSRSTVSRSFSIRTFAAAAVALVTVSSGITWMLTRPRAQDAAAPVIASDATGSPGTTAQGDNNLVSRAPARVADVNAQGVAQNAAQNGSQNPALAPAGSSASERNGAQSIAPAPQVAQFNANTRGASSRARLASRGNDDVSLIYEREIRAMRRVVDERLGDLDSATVSEVERNLNIIDKAIEDSRRALAADPRSRLLSTQLDRALENKLSIMRRLALL